MEKTKYNSFTEYENGNGEKLFICYNHGGLWVSRDREGRMFDSITAQLHDAYEAAYGRVYSPGNHKFTEAAEFANYMIEVTVKALGYREVGLV